MHRYREDDDVPYAAPVPFADGSRAITTPETAAAAFLLNSGFIKATAGQGFNKKG